ncbi:pre-rRNA-processing protein esf1 [Trapelia coarctata]|nr:pre-rRNA-processing protein esf1 [Trapelia coarctata]
MAKPVRQRTTKGSRNSESTPNDNITDPRFANIQIDPRFRLPSKKNTHVKIDKRFAHMLHDERFSSKAKVDRYGRRLPKDSGRKELERLYRVEDEEEHEDEEDNGVAPDEEVKRELRRVERKYDPARDGGFSESSSDESSDEDEDSADEMEEVDAADPADGSGEGGGIPVGEVSSRLAIVNLDWDNIRAVDLMAVFASFAPDPGSLLKVSVYPSEFGKERMEREETEGPPKEIFAKKAAREPEPSYSESEDDEEIDDEEEEEERIKKSLLKEDQGEDFDSAKLRQYQLERLRYYYAVLTCSSNSVAEAIYNSVDGTEYLTTANFFDLRFIPDEVNFSDDKPRDECDRIPDGYRPNEFVTDALQHSKVKLTWDADDKTRKEIQRRAFSGSRADIDENDLKAYLGSDSSEDEAPEPLVIDSTMDSVAADTNFASTTAEPKLSKKEAERQKMRALLGLGAESISHSKSKVSNGPVGDMQITFSSGLSSNPNKGSVFENEPEIEETTAEKYIRKEKERKARRKEKMKAARSGTAVTATDEAPKEIGNADDEPKDLGFDDPFFTAPEDDKAAATTARKEQKRQKRVERAAAEAAASAQQAELELLMIDDNATNENGDTVSRSKVNHFDINEIAKAEKVLKKKKKGKLSAREKAALQAKEKDDFKMDVADPRFGAVFERPEFAVDPSNPRFKGTEGMKALLEEGRRKRAREDDIGGTFEEGVADGLRMGKKMKERNEKAKRSQEGLGGTFEEGVADGLRMGKKMKERNEKAKKSQEGLKKSKQSGDEDLRKLVQRVKGKIK